MKKKIQKKKQMVVNNEAQKLKPITNFLFEVGVLSQTPRSGLFFLGSGKQSVAEHSNRVVYIGYTLAMLAGDVDVSKVMKMCLFHDLPETRISDLNYIHQKYVTRNEHKAVEELTAPLPFGEDIKSIIKEYEERKSPESILAKEADNLEWILTLKEQVDIGNEQAKAWIITAVTRLKTELGKSLADSIVSTKWNEWWLGDPSDSWWINRGNK